MLRNLTGVHGISQTPILVVSDGIDAETVELVEVLQEDEKRFKNYDPDYQYKKTSQNFEQLKPPIKSKFQIPIPLKGFSRPFLKQAGEPNLENRYVDPTKPIWYKSTKDKTYKKTDEFRKIDLEYPSIQLIVHKPTGDYNTQKTNSNIRFSLIQSFSLFSKVDKIIVLEDDLLVSQDLIR